jgi:hypothetical protein
MWREALKLMQDERSACLGWNRSATSGLQEAHFRDNTAGEAQAHSIPEERLILLRETLLCEPSRRQ